MRVTVSVDVEQDPDDTSHPLRDADPLIYALQHAVTYTLHGRGWQVAGKLRPDGQLVPGHVSVQLEVGR